jgi:IS1 family transposase
VQKPLTAMGIVNKWKCPFYVTDGWKVYPKFILDGDQFISKTYMIRVEGEKTRLRHPDRAPKTKKFLLF